MTTTLTQFRQGGLRIGGGSAEPPRNNTAWKNVVGQNPVPARFGLLPDAKPHWAAFGTSVGLQCILLTLLITIPMLFPQRLIPVMRYEIVHLISPLTEVPVPPPPPPPKVRMKVEPPPPVVEPPTPVFPKMVAPPRPVTPKPRRIEVSAPELKPVFKPAVMNTSRPEPARPRPPVETNLLTTGSAAPATVNKPLNQVQTGGFGDPNGLPGKGDPNKRANINQKGSWDLPGGPGYGNGTGGANGVRGTVASAGFGNGIAIPPSGSGKGGARGVFQKSGFADASVTVEAPKTRATPTTAATQPVEIIFKPNPAYTEEARRLRLEGEVLLEAVFLASGEVRVIRIIQGLGHGLDEAAARAAQQIRFKPAKRDGHPVDFPATVHIVFQLAY